MSDNDKQALLDGSATIQTRIEVVDENTVLTEENSVVDWNHEDFRQVKNEGFIGQFVARQLTGTLKNLDDDFSITDKELELKLGVKKNNNTDWYSLGNFLVTKVTDDEVNDKTSFEALDYTKKFNKEYEDTIMYPCTALELAQNVCEQCGVVLGNTNFKNNNYQITGNAFTNNESCRDVMKAIGKLAGSWVRVDWDNKVYIDFDPTPFTTETTPSTYNTFGNNKYYNLKTQKEVFGPVNRVIIGYSAIEGERTIIEDAESIDENGLCELTIYDNPLVFNQEQRESIINSYSDLLGFTYTPLNTLTVGHPWLKGNELVRVTDMEGVDHDTIPLDRTIQYFGHIKTLINSTTETKTNNDLGYKPETQKSFERSEIYNDKINKEIGAIIEEQNGTNQRLNETISTLDGTVQRVSRTEEEISEIVTTTQTSLGGNSLYLENTLESNALSYSADGATEQKTYSGKNLLNNTFTSQTLNSIVFTVNNDKSITMSGTASARTEPRLWSPNGSFRLIAGQTYYNHTGQTLYFFAQNASPQYVAIHYSYTPSVDTDVTFFYIRVENAETVNKTIYPMLTTTTDATYEPYVGATPSPNPNYPQDVKTIPSIANLFNIDELTSITNGSLTNNIITTTTSGEAANFNIVPQFATHTFKAGKTYYLSADVRRKSGTGDLKKINDYIADWTIVAKPTLSTDFQRYVYKKTFTSDTNYYRLLFQFGPVNSSVFEIKNIMIEESELEHDYVPYGHYARVKVIGKNLFDKTSGIQTGKYYNNTTGEIMSISTAYNYLQDTYINVEPNTQYTVSATSGSRYIRIVEYDNNKNFIKTNTSDVNNTITRTTTANTKYVRLSMVGSDVLNTLIMTEGSITTDYEQYKEKEVLINLAKDNIFDGELELGGYEAGVKDNRTERYRSANKIPVKPSTIYTFSINDKAQRYVYQLYDANGNYLSETDTQTGTFTTTSNCYYITFRCFISDFTNDYANLNVQLYESTDATSYSELCKIGDYKDTLSIDSDGNCIINKKIGKKVLNGSENGWSYPSANRFNLDGDVNDYLKSQYSITYLSSHYNAIEQTNDNARFNTLTNNQNYGFNFSSTPSQAFTIRFKDTRYTSISSFKSWLATNNVEIYYVLTTPQIVTLSNTKIPLFSGINHVTFVDDLQTSTSIICYLNTPLSGTYATVTQLNEVSVEKSQEIQTTRTEVINEINNSNEQIRIISETIDDTGVPILHTETGYTFDIDGIKIEKTDNDVKTIIDNDGLTTSYKGTEILTARSNGVETENITTRKFYVQKPIRMEKTRALTDSTKVGLGFYYVGE